MPAKAGFQRMTIDITESDHLKLKMLTTVLGKSMSKWIVALISDRLKKIKGMENIEKFKKQNNIS